MSAITAPSDPRSRPGPAHRVPTVTATAAALLVGLDLERGVTPLLGRHDVTRARLGTRRFVSLRRAEHVDHLFHAGRTNYAKSLEYAPIRTVAGLNLLTDEADSWAAHRLALNPMFAKRRLTGLVDLMLEPILATTDALDGLTHPGAEPQVDLHEEMVRLTLRVVANALFSQDFGAVVDSMHAVATRGLDLAETLLRLTLIGALPGPAWRAIGAIGRAPLTLPPPLRTVQEVARTLDRAVDEVVDARLARPTTAPDLLNLLLEAGEGSWGRQRVRDEALTFMLAGHETTANALAWLWYLLATHPEARARMLDEVDAVLAGRTPAADDLGALPWTLACVQESQRMYSAVPVLPRVALVDDVIDGHHIRRGTTILVPVHLLHHDPRYWEDPESFRPERFLPGAPRPHRSAFLPFGAGRRVCIGQSFALMEMVAVVATLSQRLVFDLAPGAVVTPKQSLTLRPAHGVPVVVRRRDTGSAA